MQGGGQARDRHLVADRQRYDALALQQGHVAAALNTTATIAAMIGESPDAYELAGPPFDVNTKVGIALSKDDPALNTSRSRAAEHDKKTERTPHS
jgi:hypothetical protein